jgi:hypothetical protein
MSAVTATQKATAMYQRAKNLSSGKLELEISWGTIGLIMLLATVYMGIASTGINTFSKCEEMKGKTVQENLNKYLAATLTIALTIPFTLLVMKFAKNESAAFMMIYAIMGLVGSAATLNWSIKCKNSKKEAKGFAGFGVASFSCALLVALFLFSRSRSPKIVQNMSVAPTAMSF